jgi:transcriptional regulator with XRE-family HTH domain
MSTSLSDIRKQRNVSQKTLAQRLKVPQSSVSRIEHRSDILISTLKRYVEALGGKAVLRAVFPQESMPIDKVGEDKR